MGSCASRLPPEAARTSSPRAWRSRGTGSCPAVVVEMKRYNQPGGPGTPFSFTAGDMADQGIYVEFAGKARAENGDRYAFRINLGAAKDGSGKECIAVAI